MTANTLLLIERFRLEVLHSKIGALSLPSRKALWNAITEGMHSSEKKAYIDSTGYNERQTRHSFMAKKTSKSHFRRNNSSYCHGLSSRNYF